MAVLIEHPQRKNTPEEQADANYRYLYALADLLNVVLNKSEGENKNGKSE